MRVLLLRQGGGLWTFFPIFTEVSVPTTRDLILCYAPMIGQIARRLLLSAEDIVPPVKGLVSRVNTTVISRTNSACTVGMRQEHAKRPKKRIELTSKKISSNT